MSMHKIKYALFFDFHTHMENPDVGKNFDPERFTDEIKRCGADYLGFHAKCNAGFAYYDTEIGTRHPSLKFDLFGQLAACCKKKGIALVAYFNGGISTYETNMHPEWMTRYMPGHDPFGTVSPFSITVCYNTGFREHIISMIKEVASKYPVDGFFIDCIGNYPCVCPRCVAKMKKEGVDFTDERQVIEFSRKSALEYCREITHAIREVLTDPIIYFNGPAQGTVLDCNTIVDCECLPTAAWGYEFLPPMAHFLRNLKPELQILNMTGRFYDWGDFGGLRSAESLKYDLLYGLCHGMRPNVAGHLHPAGDKDEAVFDRIADVYGEIREYDDFFEDAENLADIAIIYHGDDKELRLNPVIRSCVRMLEELKMQFDILCDESQKSLDGYKLAILPEGIGITPAMEKRIRDFIGKGGSFFACGKNAAETFGNELGIKYIGDSSFDVVYFNMHEKYSKDVDRMYLSLYARASRAELVDAEADSFLVRPYYNPCWNGTNATYYIPPQAETDIPFITVNGKCIWCAGDLFTGYSVRGATHLRHIFRNVIASMLERPLLKVVNLPSFVRASLMEQGNRMILNLLAYLPEKRGNVTMVEDAIAVINGRVQVLTGGRVVRKAYMALDRTPVGFTENGEYTELELPPFEGYAMVVLETGDILKS